MGDYRSTDSRVAGSVVYSDGWGPDSISPWYTYSIPTNYAFGIGRSKFVSSERSGRFVPGQFRLNPFSVGERTCTSDEDYRLDCFAASQSYRPFRSSAGSLCAANYQSEFERDLGFMGWLKDTSLQKAFADSGQADLALGQSLVELKETLEMLRRPFSSLGKYFAKPSFRNKMRRLGNASVGTWLEVRYGWRPLVNDVSNILAYLRGKPRDFSLEMRKQSGLAKATSSFTFTLGCPVGYGTPTVLYSVEQVNKASTGLYFRMNAPLTWQQALGVDWNSIPELVWEKVPLSFVCDWWFNVGLWLASHKSVPQREILGSYTSETVDRTVRASVVSYTGWNYGDQATIISGGKMTYRVRLMQRTLNNSLPALPSVNPNIHSVLHSVDGLCLALQRMNIPRSGRR